MSRATLRGGLVAVMVLVASVPRVAADEQSSRASVAAATNFLRKELASLEGRFEQGAHGEGEAALAGIALIEAGVPPSDPLIQSLAASIRKAGITQYKTYTLSLDIIFLDKIGEEVDSILIQSMGARLILGQNRLGAWSYECAQADEEEVRRLQGALGGAVLKGGRDLPQVGSEVDRRPRLDPAITDILQKRRGTQNLIANYQGNGDNSNTQFAVIAMWAARRHGLPVDNSMKLVEARFRQTQSPQGTWPYTTFDYSAPMTCSGLLGLAVVSGFKSERSMRSKGRIDASGRIDLKGNDNAPVSRGPDPLRDPQVRRAIDFLGAVVAANQGQPPAEAPAGGPNIRGASGGIAGPPQPGGLGAGPGGPGVGPGMPAGGGLAALTGPGGTDIRKDLYFLWSLERVCMVFGLDRLGGKDWHAWGADYLLKTQRNDGSWAGKYIGMVDTSFGLMFMNRSNIVKDLSRVLKGGVGDLTNRGGPAETKPNETKPGGSQPVTKNKPEKVIAGDGESLALTKALKDAGAAKQVALIREYTETKGAIYSTALADAIPDLTGETQRQARDGLAERMARLKASSLQGYLDHDHPELRRAAALAVYMRDERTLVQTLIDLLEDENELVWRAARLSLKGMTGKDFGPKPGDPLEARRKAIAEWQAWWSKQR